MTLSAMIHKKRFEQFATATVATLATVGRENGGSVATVATVAVANSPETKNEAAAVKESLTAEGGLTADDLEAIRAWLASIGETDTGIIAEVLEACARDAEVLAYYIGRAGEARREAYQERAAIMQYDGKLTQAEAERRAALYWYPRIENPATGYLGVRGDEIRKSKQG